MDAMILLGFLVALALAAPRWGYDSRDGFASLEYARRQAWWAGRSGPAGRAAPSLAWLAPADWLGSNRASNAVTTERTAQATPAYLSALFVPLD